MLVLAAQIVAIYNLACKDTTFFLYVQIFSNIFFSLVLDLSTTLSFFHPFPRLSPHLSSRPFLTLSLYFRFLTFLILFLIFLHSLSYFPHSLSFILYSFLIFLHFLFFIPLFSCFPFLLFLSLSHFLRRGRGRLSGGGRSFLNPISTRFRPDTIG